jgi:beta-glucosidase
MDGRTYRYFEKKPLYAFGHGLSYTQFSYQALAYDPATQTARVTLANTGARAGDEVVQVYVRDARVGRPRLQLCGFARVSLAAGARCEVNVPIDLKALRRWDEATHDYVIDAVPRELLAGGASDQLPLNRSLNSVS